MLDSCLHVDVYKQKSILLCGSSVVFSITLQFPADIMLRFKIFYSPSNDEDSTSSSDSDCSSVESCICGSTISDSSDWNDNSSEECKRARIETSKVKNTHDQLHRAIEKHDCRTIRQLLENGVKPCTTPISCFILARRSGFILKKLLEIEPSGVNCRDPRGYTMLMLCDDYRNRSIFELLYKYKPDINLMNIDGDNIFFYLLKARNYSSWHLGKLLELGLDVHSVSGKGETAVEVAIRYGIYDFEIKALIKAGANIPPLEKDGENIIVEAIKDRRFRDIQQKVTLLKVMMENGVCVNAKDKNGHNIMYYLIMAQFREMINFDEGLRIIHFFGLEDILIMLLDQNCDIMGLEMIYKKDERINPYITFLETHTIITAFIRYLYLPRVKYLEELVRRGAYNWKSLTKLSRELSPQRAEPMSPITACLIRLCTHYREYPDVYLLQKILEMCKYFISIGVDATHRSLGTNYRFNVLRIWEEVNFTPVVTEELVYPDAIFFVAQFRTNETFWSNMKPEDFSEFEPYEELLRLMLRFWPYPPLYLFLIRIENENWDQSSVIYESEDMSDMTLLLRLLIKIGGAVPLGSRYYKAIKIIIETVAKFNPKWIKLLHLFLQLDGGIPTLRSLSRAAFRATVKKTCPTGLDFSEYRVLCQGGMVPLPPEVVKFIEFRV